MTVAAVTPIDWTVIAAGTAGVLAVNWYFFGDRMGAVAATVPSSHSGASGPAAGSNTSDDSPPRLGPTSEVTITVRGGYAPAVVRAPAGQPVRLVFDRQETSGCSEEVVFGDFGIRRFLPANQRTVIEVTPPESGTYEFTCGMGMLRGKLIAE